MSAHVETGDPLLDVHATCGCGRRNTNVKLFASFVVKVRSKRAVPRRGSRRDVVVLALQGRWRSSPPGAPGSPRDPDAPARRGAGYPPGL
jgi:hypothetical protein